jgi:hypothetical protein
MRALGLLLLLIVAQASHASAERYIQLSMHVVKVFAANADGRINTGTGVQMDDKHVITNCHVVGIATNVIVARGSGGVPAQLHSVDPRHDLCVMTTPHALGRPADMATSRTLKVGDTVHAVGFSGGKALSMSDGRVTALHEMDGALVIETDASFQQGASGGALFDADGRLVGVLTFFVPGLKRHFAVPVEWVRSGGSTAELPIRDATPPFWAAADEDKPYFLRAIQHENDGDWGRLQAVAKEWVEAEPNNSADIKAAVRASQLPSQR